MCLELTFLLQAAPSFFAGQLTSPGESAPTSLQYLRGTQHRCPKSVPNRSAGPGAMAVKTLDCDISNSRKCRRETRGPVQNQNPTNSSPFLDFLWPISASTAAQRRCIDWRATGCDLHCRYGLSSGQRKRAHGDQQTECFPLESRK